MMTKLVNGTEKERMSTHGYCFFCNADIKCDNGGKVQLLKHCTQKKHKDAMKHAKNNKEAIWLYAELFFGHFGTIKSVRVYYDSGRVNCPRNNFQLISAIIWNEISS